MRREKIASLIFLRVADAEQPVMRTQPIYTGCLGIRLLLLHCVTLLQTRTPAHPMQLLSSSQCRSIRRMGPSDTYDFSHCISDDCLLPPPLCTRTR